MNYANAAFNASDRALYTLLPIASHDNDDDDDRKRRKEEIEEDRPSASCCFANYLYTNKTLTALPSMLIYCFSRQAYAS